MFNASAITASVIALLTAAPIAHAEAVNLPAPPALSSATGDAQTPTPLSGEDRDLLAREGFKLSRFPSDGIEKHMPVANGANGIPETVQGVWWVTVTPLGFLLASLGGDTEWNSDTRTAVQKLYGAGSFSFHDDDSGNNSYLGFLRNHMLFIYRFSKDFKYARVIPAMEVFGQRFEVPDSLVRYQMRWVEDGHFVRESWFFGQRVADYQLRRVVHADGSRDGAYSSYLLNADAQSVVAERN